MEFPPEHYFQTATQRMRQAHLLFQDGASYALAIYVGGVAVECMLRAYKGRRDRVFDERHDLLSLFRSSGMLTVDRHKLLKKGWTEDEIHAHLRQLRAAVNQVYRIWSNNYRFASEERLTAHLKKISGFRRIKGDFLREQARQFLSSAKRFVDIGVIQWHL